MDRSFKKRDRVQVFKESREEAVAVDVFHQQPYSYGGFDYYTYRGMTYHGFETQAGQVYILLSRAHPGAR